MDGLWYSRGRYVTVGKIMTSCSDVLGRVNINDYIQSNRTKNKSTFTHQYLSLYMKSARVLRRKEGRKEGSCVCRTRHKRCVTLSATCFVAYISIWFCFEIQKGFLEDFILNHGGPTTPLEKFWKERFYTTHIFNIPLRLKSLAIPTNVSVGWK